MLLLVAYVAAYIGITRTSCILSVSRIAHCYLVFTQTLNRHEGTKNICDQCERTSKVRSQFFGIWGRRSTSGKEHLRMERAEGRVANQNKQCLLLLVKEVLLWCMAEYQQARLMEPELLSRDITRAKQVRGCGGGYSNKNQKRDPPK